MKRLLLYLLISMCTLLLCTGCHTETGISLDIKSAYIEEVTIMAEERNYDGAMKRIDEILMEYPDIPEFIAEKGYVYLQKGEKEKAETYYISALENKNMFTVSESLYKAYINIGTIMYNKNNFNDALYYFEEATKFGEFNQSATLYNAIGLCYKFLGAYEKARENFITSIEFEEGFAYGYANLADIDYYLKDYDKAYSNINIALNYDREVPQYYIIKGRICEALEKNEEAISVYNEAIRKWPAFGACYMARAGVYFAQKEYIAAIHDYSFAKDYFEIEGYYGMGMTYNALGQYESAITSFTKYMKEKEINDPNSLYQISIAYFQLEEYEKSIEVSNHLLEMGKENTEALLLKAYAYEGLENYDEAYELLKQIIIIDPEHEIAAKEIEFILENDLTN